jgi:hypothetical protein
MVNRSFKRPGLLVILIASILLAAAVPLLALGPRQNGYPSPGEPTVEPPPDQEIIPTAAPMPYPPSGSDIDQLPIGIGSPDNSQILPNAGSGTVGSETIIQQSSDRGLFFLWMSFIATFLVLIVSVIGATILFVRRSEH